MRKTLKTTSGKKDTTEERTVELEREELLARQQAILMTIPNPAWLKDRTGRFLAVNKAWQKTFGVSEKQALGKTAMELFRRPQGRALAREDATVIREGRPLRVEHELVGLDGKRQVWNTFKGPVRRGRRIIGLVGIATDITAHKQSQEELRRSVAMIDAFFDAAPCVLNIEDEQFRYIKTDRLTPTYFGLDRKSIIGKSVVDLAPGLLRDYGAMVRKVMKTGKPLLSQRVSTSLDSDPDKAVHWIASYFRVPLPDGRPGLGVVGIDVTDRVKTQERLRESESRFRALVEAGQNMVYRMSPDGREMRELRAKGYVPDVKIPTQAWLERYIPPEDRPLVLAAIAQAIRDKSVFELEHRVARRRGGVGWVHSRAIPVLDKSGQIVEWFGVARDITLQRQAQEALRISEERHRTILETATDGFWRVDMKGHLLEVNDAYCRMSGYTRRELLRMRIPDLEANETPREVAARQRKIVARGEDRFETRHRRKNGEVFDVDVSVQKRPGKPEQMVVFLRDITERKRAHALVESSEARFRAIFDQSPVPLLELDMSGSRQHMDSLRRRGVKDLRRYLAAHPDAAKTMAVRSILAANEAALRLTGVESLKQLQAHCQELASENARILAEVPIALAEGSPQGEIPFRVRSAAGKPVELVLRYHAVPGHEETLDRVILAIVDVTAIREAQRALESAHRKLMHVTEAEQRRIARELHDSIAQQAVGLQLMLKNFQHRFVETDAATADFLGAATEHCSGVVRGLREICYGLYPQTLEQFGLPSALRQLTDAPSLAGLQTEVAVTSEAARIRLDPDVEIAIYRVAQEAVSNAMRHGKATSLAIHLFADNAEGTLVLAVTDNGKGFAKDAQPPLGLGLVSMRERAEAIRGKLTVDSRPGGGTTVFLGVPLASDATNV